MPEDQRHSVAGRQPNELFVGRFAHRCSREHDLSELVEPLLLFLDQELRITDDVYVVVPAASNSGWQGINSRDLFSNRLNRFIDYNVSGRPDNFEIGNTAIFFN